MYHKISRYIFTEVYFTSHKIHPFQVHNSIGLDFSNFTEWCNHYQKSVVRYFYAPIKISPAIYSDSLSPFHPQATTTLLSFSINLLFQNITSKWNCIIWGLWVWLLSFSLRCLRFLRFTSDIVFVFLRAIFFFLPKN